MAQIDFHAWIRSSIYDLALPTGGGPVGRLTGRIGLTLRNSLDGSEPAATENAPFKILGPPDVDGLKPQAVRRSFPSPGVDGAEATKLAMVELAAPDLPWRYTPELAGGTADRRLRPWLVLVVGREADATTGGGGGQPEIVESPGGTVTLGPTVVASHNLAEAAQWAHVQEGSPRIARIVSPRRLEPDTAYLAALVPTFKADGSDSWAAGDPSATVTAYHRWRFQTGPAGDFQTLAAKLKAHLPSPSLGRAPFTYDRTEPDAALSVRGALGPIGGTDSPLPTPVVTDLAGLQTPLLDPRGREVITLPTYGTEWRTPAEAAWSGELNDDPRHRGAAGVGLKAGITLQEELARAAREQVGALGVASQRISQLSAGLAAAGSLWNRRLPTDPAHRLAIFWPTTARLTTPTGPARDVVTAADRTLPRSLFSSGARRALRAGRTGPARTRHAQPGAASPAALVTRINRCDPPAPDLTPGLPHGDTLAKAFGLEPITELLRVVAETGQFPLEWLFVWMERIAELMLELGYDPNLVDVVLECLKAAAERGDLLRFTAIAAAVEKQGGEGEEELARLLETCGEGPDQTDDLVDVIDEVTRPPEPRPCRPVDIDGLVDVLTGRMDPTSPQAPAIVRVLGTITGLGSQPLAPPEPCVGLDLPAWRYLRDHDQEWLLPGIGELAGDTVVAVESNPVFVESFLVGLNRQTLFEMRWRNIGVATYCTPLRVFWDRVDVGAGQRVDDITGIRSWSTASTLGHTQHRPAGVTGTNLVLVFRSSLFRRYPTTIVSLTPAIVGGQVDWDATPDMSGPNRVSPVFQGKVGDDITFFGFPVTPPQARDHWVVLEEPPPGYLFRHPTAFAENPPDMTGVVDGATFADKTFNDPTLVLIRGDKLIPQVP